MEVAVTGKRLLVTTFRCYTVYPEIGIEAVLYKLQFLSFVYISFLRIMFIFYYSLSHHDFLRFPFDISGWCCLYSIGHYDFGNNFSFCCTYSTPCSFHVLLRMAQSYAMIYHFYIHSICDIKISNSLPAPVTSMIVNAPQQYKVDITISTNTESELGLSDRFMAAITGIRSGNVFSTRQNFHKYSAKKMGS